VKAKTEEPDVDIEQINIVSADAVLVNGEKKEEVLARAETELEERVLEQVWQSFEHIREWGSLVRIEERIEAIIEEKLEEIRATGQTQFTDEGLAKQSSVTTYSGEEESWGHVKERLLEQVSELAEEALEQNDPIEKMFAGEVEKSVRLMEFFAGDYDVVVSNPPYLGSGKMEHRLKEFIQSNYKSSKDLYAAFIERCTELSKPDGYVSMITREEFMFLYSFRGFRKKLLTETQLIESLHLKRYGFLNQKDIFTVGFVIKNTQPDDRSVSRFYQLTNDIDEYSSYSGKINGLEKIVRSQRKGQLHPHTYTIDQNLFLQVGRTPLIYWFGRPILDLFDEYNSLGEIGDVKVGLQTSNDDRFVRRWWEIDESKIGDEYKWYVMGGDDNAYYDSTESTIYWKNDGKEVINYNKSYPRNKDYYHLEGVNFRKFSKVFTARYQPPDQIFSDATRFVYIEECDDFALLGLLCSSLTRFIMYGLNPSLNFQAGDAKRLPVNEDVINDNRVSELTKKAISLRKEQFGIKETKFEFSDQILLDNVREMNLFMDLNEAYIQIIHGEIDNIIFEKYGINDNIKKNIYSELPKNLSEYPHIEGTEVDQIETDAIVSKIEKTSISDDEISSLVTQISKINDESIRSISEATNISPYTIAMLRYEYNLYTDDEIGESAARLLSYYIGCLMGRWQKEQVDSSKDGILAFDELFENNISTGIRNCIRLTFDNGYEIESELESKLGRDPINWLRNRFFRYHHCKEYRRRGQRIPIYWQLESNEGAFSCLVYYHKMGADTFPKIRGQYIDKKLDTLQNRLDAIESELEAADGDQARELRSEKEEIEADVDDITEFRNRVDTLIDEGFEPDFEAGIWENIQKIDEHDLLAVPLDKL
jgi:predicted RNA methylase